MLGHIGVRGNTVKYRKVQAQDRALRNHGRSVDEALAMLVLLGTVSDYPNIHWPAIATPFPQHHGNTMLISLLLVTELKTDDDMKRIGRIGWLTLDG